MLPEMARTTADLEDLALVLQVKVVEQPFKPVLWMSTEPVLSADTVVQSLRIHLFGGGIEKRVLFSQLPSRSIGDRRTEVDFDPLIPPVIKFSLCRQVSIFLLQLQELGGYMATAGADQPGTIDEESFDQILATFRSALWQLEREEFVG